MSLLLAVAMVLGLASLPSAATPKVSCSKDMYHRADASLASAADGWSSLMRHQKAFGSCDDGALAEGYSDAVVALLARRWDQFDAFFRLSSRSPNFRQSAIRHIDPTASPDDLREVVRHAAKCIGSDKAKHLCRDIAGAAREALEDLNEP